MARVSLPHWWAPNTREPGTMTRKSTRDFSRTATAPQSSSPGVPTCLSRMASSTSLQIFPSSLVLASLLKKRFVDFFFFSSSFFVFVSILILGKNVVQEISVSCLDSPLISPQAPQARPLTSGLHRFDSFTSSFRAIDIFPLGSLFFLLFLF